MLHDFKNILCRSFSKIILPNGLYCFNYHRVGEPELTQYDPNVFSCNEQNFMQQIEYIKENFHVIALDDIDTILKEKLENQKYALITFDDGYIDNYTTAFPILKKYNVPATFFLATNFINDLTIPWWDKIAYLVRHTKEREVKLSSWSETIDLYQSNVTSSIRQVLKMVKKHKSQGIDDVLFELEQKLNVKHSNNIEHPPLFMTWNMLKEMNDAGMTFGSQTCSHRIMSHLSIEEQDYEAKESIRILREKLNIQVSAFAYPVGGIKSYTEDTVEIIKKHYNLSFSFIAGINTQKSVDNYAIERISVDNNCTADQLAIRLLKLAIKKLINNWK